MERDPNKTNLVLSRKVGEELVIQFDGELVRVKVLQVSGIRAKIGIDAGRGIKIVRAELDSR